MDGSFRHPPAGWTPPPFHRLSPSRSSPDEEDLTPSSHYEHLRTCGSQYVALSAMLSSAVTAEHIQVGL